MEGQPALNRVALIFLRVCTSTANIKLRFSIILDKQQTTKSWLLLLCYFPLVWASPTLCHRDASNGSTSIHLGLLSPQSDNRAIFGWVRILSMFMWVLTCKKINSLSIFMSVNATPAQWSQAQRALSCLCLPYWLPEDQCNTSVFD